ncbi:hypothetical protein BZG36_05765, partial [Bifiguratus adelaidae]
MDTKDFKFVHEDNSIAVLAHGIKFGHLTPKDADFFRELEKYPIKEVYVQRYENDYYDL